MAYILTYIVAVSLNWGALTLHPVVPGVVSIDRSTINVVNVIALTNQSREQNTETDLKENIYLDQLAQSRAEDLASHQIFSHIDSQGKHSWEEVDTSVYNFQDFGENLAILFTNAETEQNAWMASPEHVANILKPSYQDIGVGIAQGLYDGATTTYVAVEFGDK